MAGLQPFISFSTSYPELNPAVLRHTNNDRFDPVAGFRRTAVRDLLFPTRYSPLFFVFSPLATSRLSPDVPTLRRANVPTILSVSRRSDVKTCKRSDDLYICRVRRPRRRIHSGTWQYALAVPRVRGEGLRWPSASFRREPVVFFRRPFAFPDVCHHRACRRADCPTEVAGGLWNGTGANSAQVGGPRSSYFQTCVLHAPATC